MPATTAEKKRYVRPVLTRREKLNALTAASPASVTPED